MLPDGQEGRGVGWYLGSEEGFIVSHREYSTVSSVCCTLTCMLFAVDFFVLVNFFLIWCFYSVAAEPRCNLYRGPIETDACSPGSKITV